MMKNYVDSAAAASLRDIHQYIQQYQTRYSNFPLMKSVKLSVYALNVQGNYETEVIGITS